MPNWCLSILFFIPDPLIIVGLDRYSHKVSYSKLIHFSSYIFVLQIRALSSSKLSMACFCRQTVHNSWYGIQGHANIWPQAKHQSPSQQKPLSTFLSSTPDSYLFTKKAICFHVECTQLPMKCLKKKTRFFPYRFLFISERNSVDSIRNQGCQAQWGHITCPRSHSL